jgi:hypothetical protein
MSNTQDVKIIKEYYIYSVEGLGGSDGGVQLFEATRTAAEAQANEIVRLSNTATDDSMGKVSGDNTKAHSSYRQQPQACMD